MVNIQKYTRKSDINPLLEAAIKTYQQAGIAALFNQFQKDILIHRVKFPLLEYCAKTLSKALSKEDQINLIDLIIANKTIGGNVIIGILLQSRLAIDFDSVIDKAREAIADADEWYVCDLIGERVFGVGLLLDFEKTIQKYKVLAEDVSIWVRRSLGAGGHYAIKKGLPALQVEQLFVRLLEMCDTKNQQVKQGVGWAAKTTAKFHPDIIEKYQEKIMQESVPNWFRTKIQIGLNRNRYAASKGS